MWQPLKDLFDGSLFETTLGIRAIRIAAIIGSGYRCEQVNVQSDKMLFYPEDELVVPIDLDFLILCVTDKLYENNAYQRGVRDVQVSADRIKKCLARMFAWQSGINELMPDDLSAEVRSILGVWDVEETLFGKTYHETKLPVQND